jgi:hypothetical protein
VILRRPPIARQKTSEIRRHTNAFGAVRRSDDGRRRTRGSESSRPLYAAPRSRAAPATAWRDSSSSSMMNDHLDQLGNCLITHGSPAASEPRIRYFVTPPSLASDTTAIGPRTEIDPTRRCCNAFAGT